MALSKRQIEYLGVADAMTEHIDRFRNALAEFADDPECEWLNRFMHRTLGDCMHYASGRFQECNLTTEEMLQCYAETETPSQKRPLPTF